MSSELIPHEECVNELKDRMLEIVSYKLKQMQHPEEISQDEKEEMAELLPVKSQYCSALQTYIREHY